MNRQVKRNIERFPEDFMFQLTKEEFASLKDIGTGLCAVTEMTVAPEKILELL